MGFLGTGAGIGKLFGKTLSRYTGMMVRGILNLPALSELLALYDGNTDGETLNDTIVPANIVPEPDVVEVNCLSFDGVDDCVDTGVVLDYGSSDYSVSVAFMLDGTSNTGYILEGRSNNDIGIRISTVGNNLYFSHNTVDLIFPINSFYGDGL